MSKRSYLDSLRDRGFDLSEHVPFTNRYRAKCSQCEALAINGVATHERGCPNERESRRRFEDEGE